MEPDTEKKISELQFLEQSLQGFLMQKQSIQMEINELNNAISELNKTKDEVYRIIGNVMLKAEKEKLLKEMEEKKKIFDLRIKSMEKQEKILDEKAEKLRKEVNEALSRKKS